MAGVAAGILAFSQLLNFQLWALFLSDHNFGDD
jgi:hypothetical protein